MPVSEAAWMQGMAELDLLPSREESDPQIALRGQVYRRDLKPHLTDHQWRHAVSAVMWTERWFPPLSLLRELGLAAPPPKSAGLLSAPTCETCRSTGFALVERDGRTWATPCACRQVASVAQG